MDTNTGNNGQVINRRNTWQKELSDKRVVFLAHELKNGGRGLTFPELRSLVRKKLPGGSGFQMSLIKKVAYAVDTNTPITSAEDAWKVKLPWARGMSIWMAKWEKQRIRFLGSKKAKKDYNERQKKLATDRKTTTKVAAKETSLESIREALTTKLPFEMTEMVNQLKVVMKQNHYRKLELDLQPDGKANLALEPMPQMQYTQL